MKYLPNFLTFIRIVCSALLLLAEPFSCLFIILYIVCGATDVLDGFAARKIDCITKFGAALDSGADVVFFAAITVVLITNFQWSAAVLIFAAVVAVLKIVSIAAGFIKFRLFFSPHTVLNKAAGVCLFALPFAAKLFGTGWSAAAVLAVCLLAAAEELLVVLRLSAPEPDIKGIFMR